VSAGVVIENFMRNFLSTILKKQGYHKISLKNNGAGHFKLNAKINGKTGSFILDTGASHTVIDNAAANRFNLTFSESKSKNAGGLGTDALKTRKSAGNEIEINGFKIKKVTVISIDLSHVNSSLEKNGIRRIEGVIGADILKKYKALIDYSEKALYLK
jgi:clan AA aspartic protease (TIGR02281 family)